MAYPPRPEAMTAHNPSMLHNRSADARCGTHHDHVLHVLGHPDTCFRQRQRVDNVFSRDAKTRNPCNRLNHIKIFQAEVSCVQNALAIGIKDGRQNHTHTDDTFSWH